MNAVVEIPCKGANAYSYRGFSIIVFASGVAHVTHKDASRLLAECANPDEAVAWINDYMD